MTRRAVATWAAVVVPLWVVLIVCTRWEAVQRDGWGHYLWHEHFPLTWSSLYDFAKGAYTHNNPRLGQVATFLMFTPGPWNEIFTPLLELATFYLLVALVLGRWPRTVDDALVFLVTVALLAVTAPQFGVMMFYRPYTGNYVFGLFVNLLFLIPFRFERGRWPLMLVLGFASGVCNEHTGPAVLGLAVAATYLMWRRDHRVRAWQLAGIVAMGAGGLALYFAPGQGIRYNGIAHQTLGELFGERGVYGNVEVVGLLVVYMLPALGWIAIALGARALSPSRAARRPAYEQRRAEFAILAAAVVIAVTLLLSPKIGPRLYFGSCALACAVVASMVMRQPRIARVVLVTGSALVLAFVGMRCLTAYRVVGATWAARVDAALHDRPLDLTPYPVKKSRWVFADDMELPEYRALAATALQSSIMPR